MLLKTQRSWSALIWIVVILSLILSLPINLMRSKKRMKNLFYAMSASMVQPRIVWR